MAKQTKKQLLEEIVRFLLSGGVATLVDYFTFCFFDALVFPALLPTQTPFYATLALVLATAIGFSVGLVVNWICSVRFVFKQVQDKEKVRSKKSFALFAFIGLIGLLLTEIGVIALVALLPQVVIFGKTTLFGTLWEKWIAKGITTCLVLTFNYLARKIFIFK